MRYVKSWKIFENDDYNKEDIQDIFIDMDFHNLKIKEISTSKAIELPSDFVDNSRDLVLTFDNMYNSLSIKLQITDELVYNEDFFKDLKITIERLESVFNLKLKCIYISGYAYKIFNWWFKGLDVFKKTILNILSSGGLTTEREKESLKKPHFIELMFERL
jgi:hypothetical protein